MEKMSSPGKWKTENRQWKMENVKWKMEKMSSPGQSSSSRIRLSYLRTRSLLIICSFSKSVFCTCHSCKLQTANTSASSFSSRSSDNRPLLMSGCFWCHAVCESHPHTLNISSGAFFSFSRCISYGFYGRQVTSCVMCQKLWLSGAISELHTWTCCWKSFSASVCQ